MTTIGRSFSSQWKFYVQWQPEWYAHKLVILREEEGARSIVKAIELEKIGRHGDLVSAASQPVPPGEVESFLRAAMDAAWEIGLRPTGFEDSTNELTAVRYHLEDMRLLAKVRGEKQ